MGLLIIIVVLISHLTISNNNVNKMFGVLLVMFQIYTTPAYADDVLLAWALYLLLVFVEFIKGIKNFIKNEEVSKDD